MDERNEQLPKMSPMTDDKEEATAPVPAEEVEETAAEVSEEFAEEAMPEEVPKKSALAELYDWLEIFAVSVAAVFVLFAFVARIAVVDGPSMQNTLHNGDKLLVWELFYTPKQGDVVVCQSENYGLDKPLVKRVIAVAGQTVSIDTATWTVYVDGEAVEEDYVLRINEQSMIGWDYEESYTVPEGHVFVMGDNRNDSLDSRSYRIGPIDERYIVGKVIFRFLPFADLGAVH